MVSKATTPKEYIDSLPEERAKVIKKLRKVIAEHIPAGFKETMLYGMMGYVVPHSLYPAGYHVNSEQALPFIAIASQKNFVAFYHMGIYAEPALMKWFTTEYPKHCKTKLDMGKSCIRFKKLEDIPYTLLGELVSKMTLKEWVSIYEKQLKKK